MAENFIVRCTSRAKDHGSWRAGFHWQSDSEKEVVVTREQILELRSDPLIAMMILGRTARLPSMRDDVVNEKRLVADTKTIDDSFLDGIPVVADPAPVAVAAPAPAAPAQTEPVPAPAQGEKKK